MSALRRFVAWAKQINWQTEPVVIMGIVKAVVAALAGSGFYVSDHTIAAVALYVTAACMILAAFITRQATTSAATVAKRTAHTDAFMAAAAEAMTPGAGRRRLCAGPPEPDWSGPAVGHFAGNDVIPSVEELYDVTERPAAGTHPRYKLGRLQNHDERSRAFPLPDLDGAAAIVGKRWTRRVPTFDQGQVGSCTGNAAAGWLGTDDTTRQGLTHLADGSEVDEVLARAIYSAAEVIDGDGPYPPNDNGSSGLSVAKVLKQHGLCASYSHAFSIGAVATALQTGPGLLGIPWYESMFSPAKDGRITVDLGSGLDGGHEIVIDELEVLPDGSRRYWIQNSWGDGWGVDHGRAYFTEADLVTLLGKGGDFTVPVAAVTPDPPAPSGDDASFLAALDSARPGLAAWVAAKAAAKHESAVTYAAGLLAGIGHVK